MELQELQLEQQRLGRQEFILTSVLVVEQSTAMEKIIYFWQNV